MSGFTPLSDQAIPLTTQLIAHRNGGLARLSQAHPSTKVWPSEKTEGAFGFEVRVGELQSQGIVPPSYSQLPSIYTYLSSQ